MLYSSFMFYRLQPDFRKLPQNAQMTAKQELENLLAAQQNRIFIRTYMTAGISSGTDIMLWRAGNSIRKLQEMSSAMQKTGFGKWLDTVTSFLGIDEISAARGNYDENGAGIEYGRLPFMLIKPVNKNTTWHTPDKNTKANIIELNKITQKNTKSFFFKATGLGQCDYVHLLESASAEDLQQAAEQISGISENQNSFFYDKGFFCIGRGFTEILDFLA